jgi:Mrp family chromosome partitioning ATPase
MRTEGIETLKTVARRSGWIVVLLVLFGAVAMSLMRRSEGPEYQASAKVILSPVDIAAAAAGVSQYVDPQVLDQTEQALANSQQLYDRAAARNGGTLGSGDDLKSATSASKDGGTITFSATGGDPARVMAIANAVANTYQAWRAQVTSAAVQKAISQVQAQIKASKVRDQALLDQLSKLKTLKDLAYGNVLLVEPTDQVTKTRPRPIRDALLGGFIGLFIALLVVAVREGVDTQVRSESEVEDLLNVPVLGAVETLPRRTTVVAFGRHRERYGDMYALLAANLVQANKGAKNVVIAVTSATAEEGKTTTASNLAAALATRNANVVLVDLDSRKPSLAKVFHIPDEAPGIEQVVTRAAQPEEAMWTVSLNGRGGIVPSYGSQVESAHATNGAERSGSLRVLPLGRGGRGVAGLRAAGLQPVITNLKKQFDYVVIDTPPALSLPDMTEIAELVDVVLIVVRHGRVSRRSLSALTRVQRNWPASNVAAVLVGTPPHEEGYAYYGRP